MPSHDGPLPSSASPAGPDGKVEEAPGADAEGCGGGRRSPKQIVNGEASAAERGGGPRREKDRRNGSDAEDEEDEGGDGQGGGGSGDEDRDSDSSQSDGEMDEFVLVKLMDIRKEVQCPICLGIIRKTRTVMECLHRFCRDCIDKSMRLGNKECPACRAHCASRRSLRDDPNYDALILALYPDIDKYEEEELAISEGERNRNKMIQESIAETFRRQTEALVKKRPGAKAIDSASSRKIRGYMRSKRRGRTSSPDIVPTDFDDKDGEENGSASSRKIRGYMRSKRRGRTSSPDSVPTDFDDEDGEENGNDGSRESSSVDDRHSPDVRQKRARKWPMPRRSPVKTEEVTTASIDNSTEYNENSGGARDILTTSPLRGEMLAWGKNGIRSQTRHGNACGTSGRTAKGGRVVKLVDQLRIADEFDSKFNLYLVLLPLDGERMPTLEKPYLSCQPTLSVQHLCQFIALQLSRQPKEVEIYIRKNSMDDCLATNNTVTYKTDTDHYTRLERLWEEKSLSELYPSLATGQVDLELLYSLKARG